MALTKSSCVMKSSPSSSNEAYCRNLARDSVETPSGVSVPSSVSFTVSLIVSAAGSAAMVIEFVGCCEIDGAVCSWSG